MTILFGTVWCAQLWIDTKLDPKSLDSLTLSPENDFGVDGFFGQHMSLRELDAEFLSRVEPNKFKDVSALTECCWYGYRFVHPGLRVFYFSHLYGKAYMRTTRLLGKRFRAPGFTRANPFQEATKAQITGLITATLTADAHGIPYDIWLDAMMERSIRDGLDKPLLPIQLYQDRYISGVLDAWADRNVSGLYLAKAPQYRVENYAGHHWQNAYQKYLCDLVAAKGNRAFWCSRLMYEARQLTEENALAYFGREIVKDAEAYR